jgi:hypothetical protein
MEILAFLCLGGLAWLVGLALLIPSSLRRRLLTYSLLSNAFVLIGLLLFELASWWAGVARFGEARALSIPQDYLSRGARGVVLLIVAFAGIASPAIVAWIVRRRSHGSELG